MARPKLSPLRKAMLVLLLIFGGLYAVCFLGFTLLLLLAY